MHSKYVSFYLTDTPHNIELKLSVWF